MPHRPRGGGDRQGERRQGDSLNVGISTRPIPCSARSMRTRCSMPARSRAWSGSSRPRRRRWRGRDRADSQRLHVQRGTAGRGEDPEELLPTSRSGVSAGIPGRADRLVDDGHALIVSGAFGLFRRDVVVDGGRIRPAWSGRTPSCPSPAPPPSRHLEACRITFFPDPIC